MYYLLLVLLILDCFLLAAVVLLQAGKGGGLAAMGAAGAGSDTLFGSRQATTLLTKATWWTGSIFLVLCFTLSLMSGGSTQPSSILRGGITPATNTVPGVPGVVAPEAGGEVVPGVEGDGTEAAAEPNGAAVAED